MKKVLGFLRRNWRNLVWIICFICILVSFIIGRRNILSWISILIPSTCILLVLGKNLIITIRYRILALKIFKTYKESFYAMRMVHKVRYKLYFTGDTTEVDEISQMLQSMGMKLISLAEDDIAQKILSRKQIEHIKKLDSLVKQMMSTENPNMIKGLL